MLSQLQIQSLSGQHNSFREEMTITEIFFPTLNKLGCEPLNYLLKLEPVRKR